MRMTRLSGMLLPLILGAMVVAALGAPEAIVKPGNWTYNNYWKALRIGKKDFRFAEKGIWSRFKPEAVEQLKQVGMYHRTIPGYISLRAFDPDSTESPRFKRMAKQYLDNEWPFQTIDYNVFRGHPISRDLPSEVKRLWIGDGQPEQTYRLEPLFHFFETGKKWQGSSMYLWHDKWAESFFRDRLMPRIKKDLPFYADTKHKWTHAELQKLSVLYVDEFWKDRMPVVWGMFVASYHLAMNFDVRAVGEKGASPFLAARGRGMLRQGGGNMIHYVWRGHEPTERYAYPKSGWYTIRGDEWGWPLPLMKYYFFRPYLIGANHLTVEGFPDNTGIQDIEEDGQYELSTIGHIGRDMLDFVDRHPNRGTVYSPIGLMLDANRRIGKTGGTTHVGYNLPYDDADHMNHGVLRDLLFPRTTETRYASGHMGCAPYGEIFDLLKPNTPTRKRALSRKKLLANYKVLFALGGLSIDRAFAQDLQDYVGKGGVLVMNAEDASALPASFLGCSIGAAAPVRGDVISSFDGKRFKESSFKARTLKLNGAKALYTADGKPMVTLNKVGKGKVLVVAPSYMIQDDSITTRDGGFMRRPWKKKPLLTFVGDFVDHLRRNATPIDVRFPEAQRHDTSYIVQKKGDGWVVALFSYSLKVETRAETQGGSKIVCTYPTEAVPFELTCATPVSDVVEWYEDRDVKWKKVGGKAVISEAIRGGQVLVYELQPQYIDLGTVTKPVNYALNKSVTCSSNRPGFEPTFAVDGKRDNEGYWWSDMGKGRGRSRRFVMPQWLQVDLGRVRTIDHVFVQFHTWASQSLKTRLRIYKYIVEASEDGKAWQTVLDESKNMDPAQDWGLERWFKPMQARYVRLTVQHNTSYAGAQVVEFKVMGPKMKAYRIDRKSLVPKYEVQYPEFVKKTPKDEHIYLFDMKTAVPPKIGWMPAGTKWKQLCGPIKLIVSPQGEGRIYEKSIYAQANSEIVYAIPKGAKNFVAAIGQGSHKRRVSVVFKVFVDDKLKFESPIYRIGMPVMPAVVDVQGGQRLKLVVTDAGDGIRNDYAWWGEARFIHR
jgi:NPCBM/NEW2 domain/F5/8 type C domain